MFRLVFDISIGDEPVKEFVKLGDGRAAQRLLELALKYGPLVAALFGIKLPPLDLSGVKVTAEE